MLGPLPEMYVQIFEIIFWSQTTYSFMVINYEDKCLVHRPNLKNGKFEPWSKKFEVKDNTKL